MIELTEKEDSQELSQLELLNNTKTDQVTVIDEIEDRRSKIMLEIANKDCFTSIDDENAQYNVDFKKEQNLKDKCGGEINGILSISKDGKMQIDDNESDDDNNIRRQTLLNSV